jgi:hypothetical protein
MIHLWFGREREGEEEKEEREVRGAGRRREDKRG